MSYPVLKRGASGPQVQALQRALQQAGQAVYADGTFGPATEAAVRSFQGQERLKVDGIVGPATWSALEWALGASLNIPPAPPTPPALRPATEPQEGGGGWGVVLAVAAGVVAVGAGAALAWKCLVRGGAR